MEIQLVTIPHINLINRIATRVIYVLGLYYLYQFGISPAIHGHIYDLQIITFPSINYIVPSIHYLGYPLSFLTFGTYILILNYRLKSLSLPVFLVTYVTWEILGQGITNVLHTSPNYYFFFAIMAGAIIGSVFVFKYLDVRLSVVFLTTYYLFGHIGNILQLYPFTYGIWESLDIILWCIFVYRSVNIKHEPT